jgi:hypothetical protein
VISVGSICIKFSIETQPSTTILRTKRRRHHHQISHSGKKQEEYGTWRPREGDSTVSG